MYGGPFYIQVNTVYYMCEQQCCPSTYTSLVDEQFEQFPQ
jgi:hypothetical protein